MVIDSSLSVLETAGLVRPVASKPEAEYIFRHGLLQDSAYGLLLKRQQKKLHRQVGTAIEETYPERINELAPLLANHFLEGDHHKKALHYLRLAADNARGRYANAEALEYFSSALQVARELEQPLDEADLRRERGLTYEIVGDFEAAQKDFKACLKFGREQAKQTIQWSALLDLGKLWAAKDYEVAGGYFKDALALARDIGDPLVIARSLNRFGNWHINVGNPKQAKSHHQEALEIFEALEDREGIAGTLDFLGMSAMISSDVKSGADYYERAIDLLRSMGDKQRLTSSITTYGLRFNSALAEAIVGVDVPPEAALANFQEAIDLAEELGWKAGEAFALWAKAFLLNALGRLDGAHALSVACLELAREIHHTQWKAAANCTLSRTYLEKQDLTAALEYAERGLKYANDTGSRLWSGVGSAFVGFVHMAADELDQAEDALNEFMAEDPGMEIHGDRAYWMARAELLFSHGRYEEALELLNQLIESAPNFEEGIVIPRLFRTRGRAYLALEDFESARGQLESAIARCQQQSLRVLLWRLHGDLARLEHKQGRTEAAEEQLAAGRSVLEEIAGHLSDQQDRMRFLERAGEQLSILALTTSPDLG